ncbi:hypothetical protein FOZ62_026314 [Perkinsus olseni]|uniref:Uncharacterized protein n=1 Tax=Perkinsus olseni TaxID=32597 RepID=A0A7J6QKF6_PEROL|nr:hypothetical protein FOZ62_026314 [Perkinsus olseni]
MHASINAFKSLIISLTEYFASMFRAFFCPAKDVEAKAAPTQQQAAPIEETASIQENTALEGSSPQPRVRRERSERCIYCGHRLKRGDHSRCRPLTREERLQIEPRDSRSVERSNELRALLKDKMHDVRDVLSMLEDSLVVVRTEANRLRRVRQEMIDNDDLISTVADSEDLEFLASLQ